MNKLKTALKLAMVLATLSAGVAHAQVNLRDYGFDNSVIKAATCVAQRSPSELSNATAHTYWSPMTMVGGHCTNLRQSVPAEVLAKVRFRFVSELSTCTGHKYTDDGGFWVCQVADATAVIAASGVRDPLTGRSLLDKFNDGAHACAEK